MMNELGQIAPVVGRSLFRGVHSETAKA